MEIDTLYTANNLKSKGTAWVNDRGDIQLKFSTAYLLSEYDSILTVWK